MMNRIHLAETIRKNPDYVNAVLILLTSSGEWSDTARCKKLGNNGYLTKSVKHSLLFHTVQLVLGLNSEAEVGQYLVTSQAVDEDRVRFKNLLVEVNPVNQRLAARFLAKRG